MPASQPASQPPNLENATKPERALLDEPLATAKGADRPETSKRRRAEYDEAAIKYKVLKKL